MASYIDMIGEGIKERDWEKVAKAYTGISGIKIEVEQESDLDVFTEYQEDEEEEEYVKPQVLKNKIVNKKVGPNNNKSIPQKTADGHTIMKKTPIKVAPRNLFVDTGKLYANQKQTKEEKKERAQSRSERDRDAADTVNVTCEKCGVEAFLPRESLGFSIGDTDSYRDDYVCGNCVHKKKGR